MDRLPANPLVGRALDVAEGKLGIRELCRRLVAPEAVIRSWRLGQTNMPEYKFLQLVDILTEIDPTWTDWDEARPKP
jgi:hypothetical protein